MEFKKADCVHYIGSDVVFGVEEGTDKLVTVRMAAINGLDPKAPHTYIHHVIESQNNGNVYIIQHNDGVPPQFFVDNEAVFGKVDISKLDPKLKFIYVSADELILVGDEKKEAPTNSSSQDEDVPTDTSEDVPTDTSEDVPTQTPKEAPSPSGGVKPKIESIIQQEPKASDILQTESPHASINDNSNVPIDQPIQTSNRPHFNAERCPQNLMIQVMPVQRILKSMKQPEPFTVDLVSGEIAEGRGGDFLMLTPDGHTFIEPKETHDRTYQKVAEPLRVIIGETHHIVSPQIKAYIDGLEALNLEIRDKLYLKENTPNNEEKDGQE